MMHVFQNETDWFVARDLAHAVELATTYYRDTCGYDEDEWDLDLVQVPDDEALKVNCEDFDKGIVTQTAAEWAASGEPGFLCSTEW